MQSIYYRISTSCQVLHLSVVCVISTIFLSHQNVWCPDCEEGLCAQCIEYHSLVKLSRGHTTIPISGYQKLPSYVVEVKEHCNEHNEKFNLFCREHECPCCGICMVETHRDCVDVTILKNIVKNVKTSDLFNEIDQLINEMIETIGKIRQNR
jgi:hypothetical protein